MSDPIAPISEEMAATYRRIESSPAWADENTHRRLCEPPKRVAPYPDLLDRPRINPATYVPSPARLEPTGYTLNSAYLYELSPAPGRSKRAWFRCSCGRSTWLEGVCLHQSAVKEEAR